MHEGREMTQTIRRKEQDAADGRKIVGWKGFMVACFDYGERLLQRPNTRGRCGL